MNMEDGRAVAASILSDVYQVWTRVKCYTHRSRGTVVLLVFGSLPNLQSTASSTPPDLSLKRLLPGYLLFPVKHLVHLAKCSNVRKYRLENESIIVCFTGV